jgi:N-acetylglucosamine-6-phosphate deacetylase
MAASLMHDSDYSPHFFELQVNGFAGIDFQQPELSREDLELAARALRRHGTTRILLTLITDRVDSLCAKLEHIERLRQKSPLLEQTIAGYHLEGPYLRPEAGFHGAHSPALMKAPDLAEFDRCAKAAGGNLRLITLAPEWPDSAEFIRHATSSGVRLAIGHSNASDAEIDAAIAAGLTLCTHLGNGVPMVLPRHDNIMQRLLARDELYAAFIPEGLHLPPAVLRNFVRAKPAGKVFFTTDCMAAAGAGPGRYHIGAIELDVGSDGIVREPGKENFAGSSLAMDRAVVNVERFLGWSAAEAHAACSTRVADYFGLPRTGSDAFPV